MTQVVPNWLGPFFGSDLSFENYEIRIAEAISTKERAEEAALMRTKWFDYRRLHPLQATYFFVECYHQAYGRFMANVVDHGKRFMRGAKGKDFLEHREKLSFWRLRQLCDRQGMRYDFFLGFAFNWYAERVFKVARGEGMSFYGPRPHQIGANEDLIADAMIAWEETQAIALQIAKDPYYRVSNYAGMCEQQAYEAYIVGQIKTRRHPHYALHAVLYVYDVLRFEEAIRQFDAGCVERALDQVKIDTLL